MNCLRMGPPGMLSGTVCCNSGRHLYLYEAIMLGTVMGYIGICKL